MKLTALFSAMVFLGICIIVGCGTGEHPLITEEPNEDMGIRAQADERPTTTMMIGEIYDNFGRFAPADEMGKFWMVHNDNLVEVDAIFPERIYYTLPVIEIDGVWVSEEFKNPFDGLAKSGVVINVLDNRIRKRPPGKEFILGGIPTFGVEVDGEVQSNQVFEGGDEIEVVIKHRFRFEDVVRGETRPSFTEMIFVDVIRNLTRPHVNDSFQ